MTISAVRKELQNYLNEAEDKKVLKLYSFIKEQIEEPLNENQDGGTYFEHDEELKKELARRYNDLIDGKSIAITAEEMKKIARETLAK